MNPASATEAGATPSPAARSGPDAKTLPVGPGATDSLASWLGQFTPMLRLPRTTATDIRDELEAHLTERTRDLMLSGLPEAQASHAAIAELGDAATLAASYGSIERSSRRRRIMTGTVLAVSGLTLALGVGAYVGQKPGGAEPPSGVRVYTPDQPWWGAEVDESSTTEAEARTFDLKADDIRGQDYLKAIARNLGLTLHARWQDLDEAGFGSEDMFQVEVVGVTLAQTIEEINEQRGMSGDSSLAYRVHGDMLELATRRYFDERESRLVAYDVEAVLASAEAEAVCNLISSLVEPEMWVDNGGDLASMHLVAGKLFITAPPRMHEKAAWILEQLAQPNAEPGAGSDDRRDSLLPGRLEGEALTTQVVALKHVSAAEIARILQSVCEGLKVTIEAAGDVRITADDRTNAVVVQADSVRMQTLLAILGELDVEPEDAATPQ